MILITSGGAGNGAWWNTCPTNQCAKTCAECRRGAGRGLQSPQLSRNLLHSENCSNKTIRSLSRDPTGTRNTAIVTSFVLQTCVLLFWFAACWAEFAVESAL